ncbi:hypothetical protein NKOR_06710 [Candidatus Nitrosopumilus koreensis AR1]|uniref:Uncharacterized protein n=1 Tax=Candidatus Nitrosopumilus koreensis AR1 TaxID=1229908 RepID=K0B8B6_9ARCH|nr:MULTISPECIES: hypothetical protein [Nitrosopumilus]AFS81215.1 hypothetical protein NKOR_06710 [Candidatus Nitrosopumilus koreensis AR1]
MKTKSSIFLAVIASFAVLMFPSEIIADTSESTTITPINEEISLKKTVTTMIVPEDNTLPWGFVTGSPSEYVERHPIIIQFFDEGDEMVHVAQVDVKGDGSYEYKFRVASIDENGDVQKAFDGEYTVIIYRVIPNQDQLV